MKRLVKSEGFGNVRMAEDAVPVPKPDEVLVQVKRSLISRGSELFRRYVKEEAVSPDIMGYSDAGEVVEIGRDLDAIKPGQRVMVSAPHAQYVVGTPLGDEHSVYVLPEGMSYDMATFLPLSTSAVAWSRSTPVEPGDTVVVLGQGIVGNLYSQAVRERRPRRVVTVDATDLRCRVSRECGADEVINISERDSVEAVMELTDGRGADVVVECVGGDAGIKSFEQAQRLTKRDGVIHLIALYQGGPLPLDSSLMMNKLLIGGMRTPVPRLQHMEDAAQMLMDGRIRPDPLITHRLNWQQTPEAYHMLYRNPDEALGVVLEWDR